ncbi:MAG: PilW family protein [Gammaproteobacteria bacterium]
MNSDLTVGMNQRGITLIEMMVAITVGLILLAGIVQLFASNKQAYRIQEGANVLNENSRYALNQLEYSIRMAGHFGGAKPESIAVETDAPATDCTESAVLENDDPGLDLGYGVEGFDGDDDPPLDCIPAADYFPDTDVLILRYAASERLPDAAVIAAADTQFLRARAAGGADVVDGADFEDRYDAGSGPPDIQIMDAGDDNLDLVANYLMKVEIYFIRRCASQARGDPDECDAADDTIPTLARLTLRDGVLVQEDVVAGVEQFQVLYGVDRSGDHSPNIYLPATDVEAGTGSGPEWRTVVDTRISLVLRNAERDVTFTDERTYRLYGGDDGAGFEYTVADADRMFRRKAYNASVQSRNMTRNLR